MHAYSSSIIYGRIVISRARSPHLQLNKINALSRPRKCWLCLFYLIRHDLTTVFVLCIVSVHERSSHKARRIFIDIILLLRRRRRRRGAHKSDDNINSKICERARAWRRVAVKGFTKTVLTRSWNKSETHCATLARFKSCAPHPEMVIPPPAHARTRLRFPFVSARHRISNDLLFWF